MTNGTASTLVIHSPGYDDLVIGCAPSEPYIGSTPYIVPLQTLRFNEEKRWMSVLDSPAGGEGGEAVGDNAPLVPISFMVVIITDTNAERIAAYNELQLRLINPLGGSVEYIPDELAGTPLATFYNYVQSNPPELSATVGNRWDSEAIDGKYYLRVDVEFQTQPAAISDVSDPVAVFSPATIQNWIRTSPAQTNRVTILQTAMMGSMPVLLRLLAQPASGLAMGRVIVSRRTSKDCTLANFTTILDDGSSENIYPAVAWTTLTDASRCGGSYLCCLPNSDANGVEQGRRFTLPNSGDQKGRFAVYGVVYDAANVPGIWTHRVKLVCGNIIQESNPGYYYAASTDVWRMVYVGEFELPPTGMSLAEGGYDTGPFLDWYSTRSEGSSELLFDGLVLVYVQDPAGRPCALDVLCDDSGGVINSEKLLLENFPDALGRLSETAHVVAASDGDFKRVLWAAPLGDFITLDPAADNMLSIFREEAGGQVVLEDDFESYKAEFWIPMADFETDETWTGGSPNTSNYVEGSQSRSLTAPNTTYMSKSLNLSVDGRFDDDGYVRFIIYTTVGLIENPNRTFEFYAPDVANRFTRQWDSLVVGYNFLRIKKSTFSASGSANWANVTQLRLNHLEGTSTIYFDYIRIERADPDNSNVGNSTGSQWNFQPITGQWTITEDVAGAGATLACLDVSAGVEKSALADESTPNDVRYRARVMAKRDAGYVGLIFRSGQDTLTVGAEDCYAALLDITGDKLLVRKYVNGTPTELTPGGAGVSFTSVVDTWYTIGVKVKGSVIRVYAKASASLADDEDVFAVANLLTTITDAAYSSGQCGVMSISTLGRFDQVKIVSLMDMFVPAHEATISGAAVLRTIAPFGSSLE